MKDKIKKTIDKELDTNDKKITENIMNSVDWRQIKKSNKKHSIKFVKIFAPIMLVLVICLSIAIPLAVTPEPVSASYQITLSINPKVEIVVDKNDIVTAFKPLNEDAIKILLKEDLVGMTLENATKKVLELANKYGYIKKDRQIKVYAVGDNKKYSQKEFDKVKNVVDSFITESNIDIKGIASLTEKELEDVYNYFESFDEEKYQKEINEKLFENVKATINAKIIDTDNLIKKLEPFKKDDDEIIKDFNLAKDITDYYKKYNIKLEISLENITYNDVSSLIEDLTGYSDDMAEMLKDLVEVGDEDKNEALEELIEIAKELLFEEND